MKFSIVTVVLNRREYIKQAIENVLSQGYPDFEHIIVDGGSRDGTLEVIKSYPHLKWISEKDEGSVFALNKGLALMTGDIFCWLNSDESYLPGVLHKVAAQLEAHADWDVLYGASNFVDERHNVIGFHRARPFDLKRQIVGFNAISVPSAAFVRRRALMAVGNRVDETLRHSYDHDLWIRLGMRHRMRSIPDTLSTFGIHGDSGVCSSPGSSANEADLIRARYRDHLGWYERHVMVPYLLLRRYLYIQLKLKPMVKAARRAHA